ncbi:MAG: (2Fe-2S)-binding protein [Gammaproteobacteria bacterium]|jgi:isoquinoline 1-oxidoreductase alpha subunit|nr:(2Fe-2S)-binding protein [Gammaproteobacteria bacterium]
MAIKITVNGQERRIAADPDTPLLWVLRDELRLTGAKFGCGAGQCGACTVHLNGAPVRSCVVPVSGAVGADVRTIEGLADTPLARVQDAWLAAQVPQCGYCQPGMIMAVAGILAESPAATPAEVRARLTNICRCGTYDRIAQAIDTLFPATTG